MIASKFGAKLHLLKINTINNFETTKDSSDAIRSFISDFDLGDFTLNIYNDISVEAGILNQNEADAIWSDNVLKWLGIKEDEMKQKMYFNVSQHANFSLHKLFCGKNLNIISYFDTSHLVIII